MTSVKLHPAQYISTERDLKKVIQQISREKLLAVDTESNNLYTYHGQVCLIQLSTRKQDFIIDPLAIGDMEPLGKIFADQSILKIFHAAEYDLYMLKRDFNYDFANLFDTMLTGRVLRYPAVGLSDMLWTHFGVEMDKSHQRDNWAIRPLPADNLRYAQMDTHFLPSLYDILMGRLKSEGRIEEAFEVFWDTVNVEYKEKEFDTEGYWKLGRPRNLTRREMAYLRELYLLRNDIAREEDLPHFRVMSNRTLVNLACEQPQSIREIADVDHIAPQIIRIYGDRILQALEQGRSSRLPTPPEPERVDPVLAERYMALHAWRKATAEERDLESNIIVSKQVLWELATHMPGSFEELHKIPGIGTWRAQAYGEDLLKVIAKMRR